MHNIKKIYLYLVSVIALIIMVIGGIMLINMALKTWVFTKADDDFYLDTYRCAEFQQANSESKPVPAGAKCTPEEEAKQRAEAEERKTAQKQRDAAQATAMILVASPVWFFHWRLAKKEA